MKITWELLIIGGEVLCIAGIVIVLFVIAVRNKKKRELREHVADRSRDDRLRVALENRYASGQVKDEAAQNVAYQVAYHDNLEKKQNAICVQLIENSPLSTKKYIFYIQDLIRIGSDAQNELVVRAGQMPVCEVQLIREDTQLYVKNCVPASRVYLSRERKQYQLGERLVKVRDADCLLLGEVSIQVRLVDL